MLTARAEQPGIEHFTDLVVGCVEGREVAVFVASCD
jgi:hypothetical protein